MKLIKRIKIWRLSRKIKKTHQLSGVGVYQTLLLICPMCHKSHPFNDLRDVDRCSECRKMMSFSTYELKLAEEDSVFVDTLKGSEEN